MPPAMTERAASLVNLAASAADPTAAEALALIRAYRAGDGAALGRLLRVYEQRVHATCWRFTRNHEDATDLAQQTFLNAIRHLDAFDGRAAFGTWIFRICTNACISHLRKEKLRRHQGEESMRGEAATEPLPASRVQTDEMHQRLHEALASIDTDARAMLVLRDGQGLDYAEIASVLGVPVGTVKSRLFRARSTLREEIERRGGIEGGLR